MADGIACRISLIHYEIIKKKLFRYTELLFGK